MWAIAAAVLFLASCTPSFDEAVQWAQNKQFDKAKSILIPLAEKNHGDAQRLLVEMFQNSSEKTEMSEEKVLAWAKRAEDQGNRKTVDNLWDQTGFYEFGKTLLRHAKAGEYGAQVALAETYNDGVNVFKGTGRGVYWLTEASKQGNVDAELILALMFYLGEVVPQDYPAARMHFERAARGGKASALVGLGRLAMNGLGEKKDLQKAYAYFLLANQKSQHDLGGRDMKEVGEALTEVERSQSLKLAQKIERSHESVARK